MYMPEKNKPFYYSLRYLQLTHDYPVVDDNTKFRKCVAIIILCIKSMFVVQSVLHAYFFSKYNVHTDTTEDLAVLVSFSNYIYICVIFEYLAQDLSKLYFDISDTTAFGEPSNWKKVINRNNLFTLFVLIYALFADLIYCLLKIFYETGNCNIRNTENEIHEVCGTPTPIGWPHQEISTLWYLVIITIQFIASECCAPSGAMIVMTSWEASHILICKIHHLKILFREVFDIDDPILRKEKLVFCIRYHQEIIRMTSKLNNLNKKVLGQMSFVAAISLGCIATQIVKTFSLCAILHLLGFALLVALICLLGQQIQDETYSIQDAINESKWHSDLKLAKDLQIVLIRCQKPVYIESSPAGNFNYQQLLLILKATYSYITLMNRT